jgi:L-lactate dehydrogenase complex protein LldE
MRIALFITCLTDWFHPRAGIAVVRVLEHLGHDVAFPEAQTCCGQPMHNGGFHDEAARLARRMLAVFAPFEAVVTPSASCAAMVRTHFPRILDRDDAERRAARSLAERTHEFTRFLTQVLNVDLAALPVGPIAGRVACHEACHGRDLGGFGDLPGHLAALAGLEQAPLRRPEQCCGFGGAFSMSYPTISGGMAADKAADIAASGAATVVCNDAGCTMNIAGACRRRGMNHVRFVSLAELIAEGLGLLDPQEGPS